MLAIKSATGNMTMLTMDSEPVKPATKAMAIPPSRKTAIQLKTYTIMAFKLRMHDIQLKNNAFKGGTSCQCTSAGECQNIIEMGTYKTMLTQVAI